MIGPEKVTGNKATKERTNTTVSRHRIDIYTLVILVFDLAAVGMCFAIEKTMLVICDWMSQIQTVINGIRPIILY